ncbi:MAG: TIGR03960 family B12-binding radical SAM protein, partial [Endomicrobiales bacterium]
CATNVLNMLHLAGLPLLSSERSGMFPLVIGGGPLTANPEPLADFFDAFVLGDGEEAIGDIIDAVKELKTKVTGKGELLRALAGIPGVYVPSLYRVEYNDDSTLKSVTPLEEGVPPQVRKRTVKLDKVFFPAKKIVPYLQTVHDRLNIEVSRGCPGRCRFCQAAKYYYPWRSRPLERVMALAEEGIASTGYEEIAFSALSCTDYRELEQLLADVNTKFGSRRLSISLPSLRCDQFSLKVARSLGQNKRSNLTFAPEAGTDRLREVIGKELPGSEIEETLHNAWRMGWRQVKLYFMVGLPTETEDDIEGINRLIRGVRAKAPGLNFGVTLSPFVPKAQTPFQWVAMASPETLKSRLHKLSRMLPASVKTHFVDSSVLEGALARGDRRVSKVILRAWQKGCRFDQWKEHLKFDLWQAAFREEGIDMGFSLYRERAADETLPWDHLVFAHDRTLLQADYRKAFEADGGGVSRGIKNSTRAVPELAPAALPSQTVQRLRLRFGRRGVVRFLSHLEQIEVFRRAFRRSGLPLAYTSGFSPQLKMAFGPAISVGYESESEYLEVELSRRTEPDDVQQRIGGLLPEGFTLLSVRKAPLFFPSLDSLLNVADYRIKAEATDEQIREFLARPEIIVEKKKEKGTVRIDAKPLIREL